MSPLKIRIQGSTIDYVEDNPFLETPRPETLYKYLSSKGEGDKY